MRSEVRTTEGVFRLDFSPLHDGADPQADDDSDEEATAFQLGGRFEVRFWPMHFSRRTRVAILQLIRPLTDVGSYRANRTESGWAVDKHSGSTTGVEGLGYCLVYGTIGYVPSVVDMFAKMRFGDAGTEAILRDTPKEIFRIGIAVNGGTKFANYCVDVKNDRIFDEGIQWSYSGDSGHTTYGPPHIVKLSKSKEHRLAIVKFLGLCGMGGLSERTILTMIGP